MSKPAMKSMIAALGTVAAFGQAMSSQNVERTFQFSNNESLESIQETSLVIRLISEMQQATPGTERRSLTVRGSSSQISVAEWLFKELNKPIQQRQALTSSEYRLSQAGGEVVRVFYLAHADPPHELQEVATIVRSMTDIRWAFVHGTQRALILRADPERIALAEWLLNELDIPSEQRQTLAARTFPNSVENDEILRVFFLAHTKTPHDLQEVATLVRAISNIRRVFTYNGRVAVTLRAPPDQIAAAEWLLRELDKPVTQAHQNTPEYRLKADNDNVLRVFYLPQSTTVAGLQETAVRVRSTTGARYVFTYNAPRAMALRGSVDQIASAERLLKDQ